MRIKYLRIAPLGNSDANRYIRAGMKQPLLLPRARLKAYQKLSQKKFRRSESKFLAEGFTLVSEALDSGWAVEAVAMDAGARAQQAAAEIIRKALQRNVPVFDISARDLGTLSDTVTSQGVVAVVSVDDRAREIVWTATAAGALFVALENVADPGNVGTILRTCDWFGADGVLLGGGTVELFNPKVVRASMGSLFHVPVFECPDLCDALRTAKRHGFRLIVAVVSGGEKLPSIGERKSILVLGSEARGISEEVAALADERVTIPRYGRAESLNVAVACGVLLGSFRVSAARIGE